MHHWAHDLAGALAYGGLFELGFLRDVDELFVQLLAAGVKVREST
jgi:hypothetical protein